MPKEADISVGIPPGTMRRKSAFRLAFLLLAVSLPGCASGNRQQNGAPLSIAKVSNFTPPATHNDSPVIDSPSVDESVLAPVTQAVAPKAVRLASAQESLPPVTPERLAPPTIVEEIDAEKDSSIGELPPAALPDSNALDNSSLTADQTGQPLPATESQPADSELLALDQVIDSVYLSYPLLDAALQQRTIAAGEQLSAQGNFDLGLSAASENGTLGYYRTHRQRVGLSQPLYQGGEAFAGYRIGRGHFEPWYKERQTNDGGEFHAGLVAPLARDRRIDPKRAELWRASVGIQLANPEIQSQLIAFVREAGYSYWQWVAAGEKLRITERILNLAEERTEGIRRQVEEGLLDPPELTDNLRLVAERQAALADATRRLRQAALELSLYYRGPDGRPLVPYPNSLPRFPEPAAIDQALVTADISEAINQRPELAALSFVRRQLEIDLAQASNESRPALDAVVGASQDAGQPATPLDDKGEFQLDAALLLDVPVQRRKARGKMLATQAKLAQLGSKRRLAEEQIATEVQSIYAGLVAAYERVQLTQQALEYANELAQRERRNYQLGSADLLTVALREQFGVEAAEKAVDALLLYFIAQTDYRASLARDQVP